jgi:hypothetical protein
MSAGKLEYTENRVNWLLKIVAYAVAYLTSFAASVFGSSIVTVIVYQLTYFKTLNDGISFYTFLASVPLSFIFLSWLAVPKLVNLLLKDIRRFI